MKKLVLLTLLAAAPALLADEITFHLIFGAPGSLTASAAGLSAGPATNTTVSDGNTGMVFALPGTFSLATGASSTFTVLPMFVLATYGPSGAASVSIVDPSLNPLVTGVLADHANNFITPFPDGDGAFAGTFDVSFVSPAVLALFGLGPGFAPEGSIAITFAHDNFNGTDVIGQVAGGSVTIETATPVPEPATILLMGISLFTMVLLQRAVKKL